MKTCQREPDNDKHISLWTSCVDHFLGDHKNCSHPEKQETIFWEVGFENEPLVNVLDDFV